VGEHGNRARTCLRNAKAIGMQRGRLVSGPGKRKPRVFPEPVLATPTTSLFCKAAGQDWAWMMDGWVNPACLMHCITAGGIGASSNRRKGSDWKTSVTMRNAIMHHVFQVTGHRNVVPPGQFRAVVMSWDLRQAATSGETLFISSTGMFVISTNGRAIPPPLPPPP